MCPLSPTLIATSAITPATEVCWLLRHKGRDLVGSRGGGCLGTQDCPPPVQRDSEVDLEVVMQALRAPAVDASEVSLESLLQVIWVGSQHLD